MAGSPKKRSEREQLVADLNRAEQTIAALRQALAASNPGALKQIDQQSKGKSGALVTAPAAPLGEITEASIQTICEKVEALGREGLGEAGILVAIGADPVEWGKGKARFPRLAAALARARLARRAFLENTLNRAVAEQNNRIPVHAVKEMLSQISAENEQAGDGGDAAGLVLVDLREGGGKAAVIS